MSFRDDIKKPFNLITLTLAVIAVGLAVYFYLYPHKDRGIAYVATSPSLIYDSKSSGQALRLIDANNAEIKSDTYLQTFTIWNSGTAPIEPSDVRRPIAIVFDGVERILDYHVIEESDSDISGFELSRAKHDNIEVQNALELSWRHFDPKRGVKVQVIFSQRTKPKASISGTVLGIDRFTQGQSKRDWGQVASSTVAFSSAGITFLFTFRAGMKDKTKGKWIGLGVCFILFTCCLTMIWLTASQYLFNPTPPF